MPDSQYKNILFINEYTGDKGACNAEPDADPRCTAAISSCGITNKTDYIELYNDSDDDISVDGFTISNNDVDYVLGSYTIPSKGLLFLCANEGNSGLKTNFDIGKSGGDLLSFKDSDGNDIDSITTINTGEPDNSSHSRICNGGEWASAAGTPTPGQLQPYCDDIVYGCTDDTACNWDQTATNSCNQAGDGEGDNECCVYPIPCLNTYPTNICLNTCPPLGTQEILINEISTEGTSHTLVYADGDGSHEDYYIPRDWVELYNPNDYDIDINGWTFTDGDYPGEADQRNILNQEFIIPAKGFAIIVIDDCDGNNAGPWWDRHCLDHPGEQNNATILPGQGVQVEQETGNTNGTGDGFEWDRIYTDYPAETPGVIRLSFKLGGTDAFKIYNGDPVNGGVLVDQFLYQGHPAIYEDANEIIVDQSYARLWDGGDWGEVRGPGENIPVTYGTSNGDPPIDDSEITYGENLNLVTIEGTYKIQGVDIDNPQNDVLSLLYSGKSYQISNSNVVENGKVRYSVTFDGGNLSEYAVGFNLRTEIDSEIVVLRSSEVVPVTNILGGQIIYDVSFIYDYSSLVEGCTDPTAVNYENGATLDNGSCYYEIMGCDDINACTCENPLCFQFCEFCGTSDAYRCVSEAGFYNQNPNATGGDCQYPPDNISVSFELDTILVEDFDWIPEYREDDDGDEFIYTYLQVQNPININFGSNQILSYTIPVNGVYLRECSVFTTDGEDLGSSGQCEINLLFDGEKTEIFVNCIELQEEQHSINCSVNDIIKLHSCIEDVIFIDDTDNQLLFEYGDNPCFDINPTDNLQDRLLKLNKLNGKLYTWITNLHRGANKWSMPILAPFCCKTEWEMEEAEFGVINEPSCTGTYYAGTEAIPEHCEGSFIYHCGAPNSGDLNADGKLNVIDVNILMKYLIRGESALNTVENTDGVPIYYHRYDAEPLCEFFGEEGPTGEPFFNGIADTTQNNQVDINDLLLLVQNIFPIDSVGDIGQDTEIDEPVSNTLDCEQEFQSSGHCYSGRFLCDYQPDIPASFEQIDCASIFDGSYNGYFSPEFNPGDCPTQEGSGETTVTYETFDTPDLNDILGDGSNNRFCAAGCADAQETANAFCVAMGFDSALSWTSGDAIPQTAYYCGENMEYCTTGDPGWNIANNNRPQMSTIECQRLDITPGEERGCVFSEEILDDVPFIPGTDRVLQHSSELRKCGDSYPQRGIINSDDFYDFDISSLKLLQNQENFLDFGNDCLGLGGYVDPQAGSKYSDEGPFRSLLYEMEYLGSDVDVDIDGAPNAFEYAKYGAIQLVNDTTTGVLKQVGDGSYEHVPTFPSQTKPRPHGYSPFRYYLCAATGTNGVNHVGDDLDAPALVNDEFCQVLATTEDVGLIDEYGHVAEACCTGEEITTSFKIPYYGVLPPFNYRTTSQDYYYRHSYDIIIASRYSMGVIPPCKEFLYNKITTGLAFDETLSDVVDELGFSYSIKVIEFETELISHVIISGDTLPSIWLGTLTDLNVGEGYTIKRFTPTSTYGGDLSQDDDRLINFRFQMEYDRCGICSEGSALHSSNSDLDDLYDCCLYPNKIINYYLEDNQFNTGVGKTYLERKKICDNVGDTYNDGGDIFYSEYNSDSCPGTLDCLGICHRELSLDEAQLLTIYAKTDIYGSCCLQGNIDLCGVCNGDSSTCDTSDYSSPFGLSTLQMTEFNQNIPNSGDDKFNTGHFKVQVTSEASISEIKFTVIGLNITRGDFSVGSEQPDFYIFTTPTENGTDIIIAPILSSELFPLISEGTFEFGLEFNDIVYSAGDFESNSQQAYIDVASIQIFKLNQSLGTSNTENILTGELTYYGCGEEVAANYDEVCGDLDTDCIQEDGSTDSLCIFTEVDCFGEPDGDAFLNICGICVGGLTDIAEDTNDMGGYYGQDCNGDCFGTAHINTCEVCVLGNTGKDFNYGLDCFGLCSCDESWENCTAYPDECGICSSAYDDTSVYNLGCGCFVQGPVPHYEDFDFDGLGDPNSDTVDYCLVFGTQGTPTTGLAPANYSPIAGDPDPICPVGTQYDCGGNCIINGVICPGELTAGNPPTCDIAWVVPKALDDCGECDGNNEDQDECGVCFGDNSSCADCAGEANGSAVLDCLGECDGDAEFDCAGTCGGDAYESTWYYDGDGDGLGCDSISWSGCSNNVPTDYVENADEDESNSDNCICPDDIGFDDCDVCGGDNLDKDCAEVCFGPGIIDDCGTCISDGESDFNLSCSGCTYQFADNYDDTATIDDGSCVYTNLIKDIYDTPAIYIQGGMELNFIGFFLPDNIPDEIESSNPLVCTGTLGDDSDADLYCAESGYEGEPCGLSIVFDCQQWLDFMYACDGTEGTADVGCDFDSVNWSCTGTPDCDLIEGNFGPGFCEFGGICEKYEIHRIMKNSFYDISTNPDTHGTPVLQEYSIGDNLRIISYDNDGNPINIDYLYNSEGQFYMDLGNYFRTGVGYYLQTQNPGWFKITPTREIFNWEES